MNAGFKSQLKDVLSDAVSYFQDSGDPNAACVKAANEAGFNQDQADRLVETFNTARVICHYKAAEDKTSSCSLADKTVVRKQLKKEATSEKSAEYNTADYGCYKQAEIDYVVPEVKMAEFTVREDLISKEAEDWLACREAETVRELLKSAEEEARAAYAMADELAIKVAERVSRNVSLDDVHDKMARMVVAYALDDRYAPGVEKVAEFIPAASDPDTRLLDKYAAMHIIDTDDLQDLMPAIKEAADFVAEAAALEAYCAELRKSAAPAPVPVPVPATQGLSSLLDKRNKGGAKKQDDDSWVVKSMKSPSFIAYLRDSVKGDVNEQSRREIERATDTVNNIRRQLILQDLLVRDKVLSQEDPNTVTEVFRSINQISPDSTLNKEMLRSMLRSAVQSVAISPFDAKALADVDKARHQAYDMNQQHDNVNKGGK